MRRPVILISQVKILPSNQISYNSSLAKEHDITTILVNLTNSMIDMLYTLKSFNTWQITLPKAWRSKYKTQNFTAEETSEGLLIKPLNSNGTVYYEDKQGFGLYAEDWLDTNAIIQSIKSLRHE
jgi:bifunctional DNA-binding transcriptional regulator/antitoxin component of YhaV-PrlF toxin-antitoxin module